MNAFQIHKRVIDDYSTYIQSFINISDDRICEKVETELNSGKLWPDPLVQFNPPYAPGANWDSLIDQGVVHRELQHIFYGRQLYKHQEQGLRLGCRNKDFVVTSGTGSGKSLIFLGTIFHQILQGNQNRGGIQAIIVYPMNALINSQTNEIDGYKETFEKLTGNELPITYKQYTGQEQGESREEIRKNPPNILLTNYMMLELLLTRSEDFNIRDSLIQNLNTLVFDELHTYRGRQGADIGMLIRRLRAMTQNNVLCIGTSATMVSRGTLEEQRSAVARFATTLFGKEFTPDRVVQESLIPSISATKPGSLQVKEAITKPIVSSAPLEDLRAHPTAQWLEAEIALETKENTLVRKRPLRISEIVARLTDFSGTSHEICHNHILELLTWINELSKTTNESTNPVLPFKIHQFIAQTGSVYVTLEPAEKRTITLEAGYAIQRDDSQVPIYPVVFSRTSGREFICVSRNSNKNLLVPRDFRERLASEDDESIDDGYIVLDEDGSIWDPVNDIENLPDAWLKTKRDGSREVSPKYRSRLPERIYFNEKGSFSNEQNQECPYAGWFMPVPLLFDPTSGTFFDPQSSEAFKLMRLGNEGRSTATTVLTRSLISAMRDLGLPENSQKVLSFTDNRQDAALQAGHFNDFVRVGQLRSAIYRALAQSPAGGLDYSNIAYNVLKALNLRQEEYATNPSTVAGAIRENEEALRDYLNYRIFYDLRRGWRVVLPNLEQCALLKIEYKYLDEVVGDNRFGVDDPILHRYSAPSRQEFLTSVLDYFRRAYALSYSDLDPNVIRQKTKIIKEKLKYPWSLGKNESIEEPYYLRVEAFELRGNSIFTASIGPQSMFGKYVKQKAKELGITLGNDEYTEYIHALMKLLNSAGYIHERTVNVGSGVTRCIYQLNADKILWQCGDGTTARTDEIRIRSYKMKQQKPNEYFQKFYKRYLDNSKSILGAEHTAQLDSEKRIVREEQFRSGEIKALFCSPTMELGIDIRTLHSVHLRNVPPTPAHYAQRGGRAGRSGQAALIFTYCSNYSPHDKHYFQNSADMVFGAVVPPMIDLLNEELLQSHLHSIYLSEVGLAGLEKSIAEIADEEDLPRLPLKSEVSEKLLLSKERTSVVLQMFKKTIKDIEPTLKSRKSWYNDDWILNQLEQAPQLFNAKLERWRTLYRAADSQIKKAQEIVNSPIYGAQSREKRDAIREQYLGIHQKDILVNKNPKGEKKNQLSEFYPYRYLAAEGFLPGYNFTRLPIRTFVETEDGGEYISRPRFIALREFGPQNILYHDGGKYRVRQMIVADAASSLHKAKVVKSSGYILLDSDYNFEVCPFTKVQLSTDESRELYHDLLEMSETRAEAIERISCEEEERTSSGYETRTYFRLAGVVNDVTTLNLTSNGEIFLKVQYLPAATLVHVNHKWRSAEENGFSMGMKTGIWKRERSSDTSGNQNEEVKRIRLFTTDTADALYIQPIQVLGLTKEGIITLQYALKRAIENIFQIEPRELGVETMGETDQPNMLIYEAAEGSLGVLSQLVDNPGKIRQVFEEAYSLCYFRNGIDQHPERGPATYDDLLSYFNQRHHAIIDRHLIKDALEKLLACDATVQTNALFEDYDLHYRRLESERDSNSTTEYKFLKYLYDNKIRLPDNAQYKISGYYVLPDFFYRPNVCIFCDGTPHDTDSIRQDDKEKRDALKSAGYQVLTWHYMQPLDEFVGKRPDIFKKVK